MRWGASLTRRRKTNARHQFDQLITPGLGLGLNDVVVDEPSIDLGVGPCVVNLVRGIVIVFPHLLDEVITVLLVVRLDQPLAYEPGALNGS